MVLLCGGARSGLGDGAPDTGRCLGALEGGDESRNLPEGACSRLLQKRDPKATLDIWALQTPQTSRLLQNVFLFFYGIQKRR